MLGLLQTTLLLAVFASVNAAPSIPPPKSMDATTPAKESLLSKKDLVPVKDDDVLALDEQVLPSPPPAPGENSDDGHAMKAQGLFLAKSFADFVHSLPSEERDKLLEIIQRLNESKAQLVVDYKNFSGGLPDEFQEKADGLLDQFNQMKESVLAKFENTTLNGTALLVYQQLRSLVLNDSLSPLEECEHFQTALASMRNEDRKALKMSPHAGRGDFDCAKLPKLEAKFVAGLKAGLLAGGQGKEVSDKPPVTEEHSSEEEGGQPLEAGPKR